MWRSAQRDILPFCPPKQTPCMAPPLNIHIHIRHRLELFTVYLVVDPGEGAGTHFVMLFFPFLYQKSANYGSDNTIVHLNSKRFQGP